MITMSGLETRPGQNQCKKETRKGMAPLGPLSLGTSSLWDFAPSDTCETLCKKMLSYFLATKHCVKH